VDRHARRAEALAGGLFPRVTACRTVRWKVRCACKYVHEREALCGARMSCKHCSQHYWQTMHRKVIPAVDAAERAEWRLNHARPRGERRFARMLTLTMRNSGDVAHDLDTITTGWARLRAWFAKRGLRRIRFVRVVEITKGEDVERGRATSALGHVHAHVLVWLPFVAYDEASAEWSRATNGESTGLGKILPLRGGSHGAAVYVGSYATKGYQLDGDLAAEWWAASYGRQIVSTSVGLFGPLSRACPECGKEGDWTVERVERPTRWQPVCAVEGGPNARYPARGSPPS
jgi:hypothetical protein